MLALRCVLLCGLLLGMSAPASAVTLLYTLTGAITYIDPDLEAEAPPFAVSDAFSLTVAIDAATVGSSIGADTMKYQPTANVSLTLAPTWTMAGDGASIFGYVAVGNEAPRDNFQAWHQAMPGASVPPDLGIFRPMQIIAHMQDADGSALSSSSLPTSLDAADWTFLQSLQVIYRDPNNINDQRSVYGTVTGLSVASVPEPSAALLTLLGIGSLALARSR